MPTRAHNDLLLPFDYVQAKIQVPAPRPGSVFRTALVNRLRAARGHTAVSLVAPAGYGKTTLLAQLADRDDRAVRLGLARRARQRPDRPHAARRRRARRLRAAHPRRRPRAPLARRLDLDRRRATARRLARLGVVAHRAGARQRLAAPREGVGRGGRALAAHVPDGSTLVLSGRVAARLPVTALRTRGRLLEIGPELLALSRAEARALLDATGVDLTDEQLEALFERTEGWAAGLYLAALAIRDERRGRRSRVARRRPLPRRLLPFRVPRSARPRAARVPPAARRCSAGCPARSATRCSARPARRRARVDRGRAGLRRSPRPLPGALPLPPAAAGSAAARGRASRAGDGGRAPPSRRRVAGGPRRAGLGDSARRRRRRRRPRGADRRRASPWARSTAAAPAWSSAGWPSSTMRQLERHPAVAVIGAWLHALRGRPAAAEHLLAIAERSGPAAAPSAGVPLRPCIDLVRAALCRDGLEQMLADARSAAGALPAGQPLAARRARARGHVPGALGRRGRRGRTVCASRSRRHRSARSTRPSSQRSPSGRSRRSAATATPRSSSSRSTLAREPRDAADATAVDVLAAAVVGPGAPASGPNRGRARGTRARARDSARRSRTALPWLAVQSWLELARAHVDPARRRSGARRCSMPLRAMLERRPGARRRLRPASSELRQRAGRAPRPAGSAPDPR